MINISTRQLRAFLLVAKYQSFSRAAEHLFMTQSGLSVLVQELELQLGFRLFDRTTRKVTLTEYGAQFRPIAERNVQDLDATVSSIGRSASKASLWLAIGSTPLMAANLLPEAIRQFSSENHDARIRLVDADRIELMGLVKTGQLDMGLGLFVKQTPDIRRIPIFRFSLMVIRPDDGSPCPRPLRWRDLNDRTLIGSPPDTPMQQLIDKHLLQVGGHAPPDLVYSHLETKIAMVETGAGMSIIPTFALPVCRKRQVLIEKLIDPVVEVDLYEIRNRAKKLPPGAETFTTFLKNYIEGWAQRENIW